MGTILKPKLIKLANIWGKKELPHNKDIVLTYNLESHEI